MKKIYNDLGILVFIFCFFLSSFLTPFSIKVTYSNVSSNTQNTLSMTKSAGNNSIIEDWPTFHGNFNRTGATETTPKEGNNKIWSFKIGKLGWQYPPISSPAISNGYIYVGSNDNKCYCLNATNGALIWNYTTKGIVQSTPTIANGRTYFGSYDNSCYCLNATTGTLLWNYTTGNIIINSVLMANGRVYFSSFDNYFYCLNGTTGKLLWKLNVGEDSLPTFIQVWSSPAISNGYVYIGGLNNHLYCLNATQGAIIWDLSLNTSIYSTPVIENGSLYIANGNLYCLNATTGAINWIASISGSGFTMPTPSVVNGYVYAGGDNGIFYCFNAKNGETMWKYPMGGYIHVLAFQIFYIPRSTSSFFLFSSPAVANEMVYIGSPNGNVYCMNVKTGKLMWNYTTLTRFPIYSSPAIYNGAVYIEISDGNLYCLPMIMPYTSEPPFPAFVLFEIPYPKVIYIIIIIPCSVVALIIIFKRINSKHHMRMRENMP